MTSNADLWARREAAIPRGVGSIHQRFFERGQNAEVFDAEGTRYIDFATGIAVCNTGHSEPRILAAVKAQLDKFSHCSFQVTPYEPYIELAEKLNALAPGKTPKKTIFFSTGSEALENAVKIARAHTGRHGVITFQGGYHGRTLLTLAMTGKVLPYKAKFGPMPADIYHARYPIHYHCVTDEAALASLEDIFRSSIEPSAVAAIALEPVLGEGGFYRVSYAFMRALRDLCDKHGIMLICDEVQSGFARTGRMFAMDYCHENDGVEPDLMTIAKAMAGGFPISGVIGKAEVMDAADPGGLGGTYGGSPLGCVAGLEVLKIIKSDNLCARADTIGGIIKSKLKSLRDNGMDCIGDVRGPGAMVAMELVKNGDMEQPDADLSKAVVQEAATHGLLLISCGVRSNVIRFLPALTASDAIIEEGVDILASVLEKLAN